MKTPLVLMALAAFTLHANAQEYSSDQRAKIDLVQEIYGLSTMEHEADFALYFNADLNCVYQAVEALQQSGEGICIDAHILWANQDPIYNVPVTVGFVTDGRVFAKFPQYDRVTTVLSNTAVKPCPLGWGYKAALTKQVFFVTQCMGQ